eukprot:scaffold99711_cov44-Attheya_sp.AAC.2
MIDPVSLFDSERLCAPTLASFNACKTKADLLALVEPAPARVLIKADPNKEAAPADKFEKNFTRTVVVIPPFLANEWVDNDSRDPLELLLQALAAMSNFDTLYQGNALIPNAGQSMLHVLQFLWAAHHKRPHGVPLLVTTEPMFEAWRSYLHKTCIIPPITVTGGVHDATMQSIASSLSKNSQTLDKMHDHRLESSSDNKKNFKQLHPVRVRLILNASSVDGKTPAKAPTKDLASFYECKTVGAVKIHLEHSLTAVHGCILNLSTGFVTAL